MSRKYLQVLEQLKATGRAELTVSGDNLVTTISGVKKIKSEDNRQRQNLGLMRMNRMTVEKIRITSELWKVVFTFTTDTLRL
jgi:hypothetical protein